MDKNKKMIVTVLLVIACLIAIIPLFALKGAEFGGSDDAGTRWWRRSVEKSMSRGSPR